MDRETVTVKVRREIQIKTLYNYWETGKISTNSLNGKLNELAVRGENLAQQRLHEAEAEVDT